MIEIKAVSSQFAHGASMMRSTILSLAALALASGCAEIPRPAASASTAEAIRFDRKSPEWRGERLAKYRCADCHSVDHGETSPVPDAPSFGAIANTPGLSSAMLAQWLRDHGNYPDEMYFEIPAEHVDDLAAYMVTLRRN
ncbi:hypothetical protein [Tsuneonella dongtanensis]|uniref:hypothetical protein n=1 Tax=Tsuneonella dongtanensis TaxID=692370 RepID=UPI0012EEDD64|nr:hypothetical protein [Tsuneonella dongtanensis]